MCPPPPLPLPSFSPPTFSPYLSPLFIFLPHCLRFHFFFFSVSPLSTPSFSPILPPLLHSLLPLSLHSSIPSSLFLSTAHLPLTFTFTFLPSPSFHFHLHLLCVTCIPLSPSLCHLHMGPFMGLGLLGGSISTRLGLEGWGKGLFMSLWVCWVLNGASMGLPWGLFVVLFLVYRTLYE